MPEKRWLLLEGEEIEVQEKLIEDAIQAHNATHQPNHRPPFALSSIRHKLRASLAPVPSPGEVEEARSIDLAEPLPAWGAAKDQEGVMWLTCHGLAILNLDAALKRAAGIEVNSGEVGRLRALLSYEARKLFTEALSNGDNDSASENATRYVNRLFDAVFPSPSGSQGDQERNQ